MEQQKSMADAEIIIAVFGGGGAVGSCLIGLLQKWGNVSKIFCIDSNEKRTKNFIKNWDKVTFLKTDSNGYEKIVNSLWGCNLVVNAASSALNRWIMKIAWEIGAHYLDFASLQNDVAEQKSFNDRYRKKGISAWINWGIGPGLTNTIAAKLIRGLRDCVIKIWVAEQTDCDQLIFLWNPSLIVDEITSEMPAFSKNPHHVGQKRQPFSCPEFCFFPEPIGKIVCYNMNENEGLTLSDLENVKEIQVKSGGSDIEKLIALSAKIKKHQERKSMQKFLNSLPQTPNPQEINELMKKGFLRQGRIALVVEIEGIEPKTEEKILRHATWLSLALSDVPRGTTHISFNTAAVAFCAILQMLKMSQHGKLKPGVFAPEYLPTQAQDAILACVSQKTNPVHFEM